MKKNLLAILVTTLCHSSMLAAAIPGSSDPNFTPNWIPPVYFSSIINFSNSKGSPYTMAYFAPFDGAVYTPNGIFYVESDIDSSAGLQNQQFANIAIGFTSNPSQVYTTTFKNLGILHTFEFEKLSLDNAHLTTETKVLFSGANNKINLSGSSSIFFQISPNVISGSTFSINATSGSNVLQNMSSTIVTDSIFNITGGASLNLKDSGSVQPDPLSSSDKLLFRGLTNGLIDNASTLLFNYSVVEFEKGTFNFLNNSTLELLGSNSGVKFDNLTIDSSNIKLQRNTSLISNVLNLNNANINMQSGTTISSQLTKIEGNIDIDGDAFDFYNVIDGGLLFLDNPSNAAVWDQKRIHASNFDSVYLEPNLTINIEDSKFYVDKLSLEDGTINLVNGELYLEKGLIGYSLLGTINLDSHSFLQIEPNAFFTASNGININNDGAIRVYGEFRTNGDALINGIGTIKIYDDGILSPGKKGNIAALTLENKLDFGEITTLFEGGHYAADIGLNGTSEINDEVIYKNKNVDITHIKDVNVSVIGSLGANALDNKQFTIIHSEGVGSTGTIIDGGNTPVIVEDSSVPALINFSIVDLNTNGHPDVTLVAQEQHVNTLITHPGVQSNNHAGSASLLINAHNAGNSSIANALNLITNGQVANHFDSFHAEPYSSYMTVSLEHTDMIMNTVLNHASSGQHVNAGQSKKSSELQTHQNLWSDISYVEGDIYGDDGLGDFEYTLSSMTFGGDIATFGKTTVGAFFSFGQHRMDEHDLAVQDFDSKVYHAGGYMNHKGFGDWDIRSVLGYAYGDNESERQVYLGHLNTKAAADYDSHSAYLGVAAQTNVYNNSWVSLSPELGLNYTYYYQEGFKESGDPDLSLKLDSADAQSIVTSVGINAQFANFTKSHAIYPMAFMRYEHDWYANKNNEHEVDAAIISHSDYKQSFVGQNRGEHAFITGLGIGSAISNTLQINGGIIYADTSNGKEWGAGLNIGYQW